MLDKSLIFLVTWEMDCDNSIFFSFLQVFEVQNVK
jgi:hypothetical protein